MLNENSHLSALADRVLQWEGTHNTRDLGGYQTESGQIVRWRRLFRSDHLGKLTPADQAQLLNLDLYALVDLRSPAERAQTPNNLPSELPFLCLDLPIYDERRPDSITDIGARIRRGRLSDLDPIAYLLASNRFYVRRHASTLGRLARLLLEAAGQPVLFHCTAGKDRTGFAAAVILSLLGVAPEQIMADYLLTNDLAGPAQAPFFQRYANLFGPEAAEKVKTLFLVQPQFLETALATIVADYGSFAAYTQSGLGLSPADVQQLRRAYTDDR